jgi:hypothetical protein
MMGIIIEAIGGEGGTVRIALKHDARSRNANAAAG